MTQNRADLMWMPGLKSVPGPSSLFRAIPRHPRHPRSILLLSFRDRDGSTPDRWLPNNWADCDSAQLMVQW